MVIVTKKKGESDDNLFRRFTRFYVEDNFARFVKDNLMFYVRPSQLNKVKKQRWASQKKRRRRTAHA